MPAKKLTVSKVKKQMDVLVSKVVRLRDGRCLRCRSTENLQASHVASRKHLAGRWDEHNILTLCTRCHLYWWHKEPIEASEWLKETYPSVWENSLQIKNEITNYSLQDYLTMKEQLQARLKVLEER